MDPVITVTSNNCNYGDLRVSLYNFNARAK